MVRITIAGLRAHKLRALLTGIAVMVGVSFLAGTLIYGDTATAAYYDDLARPGVGVDVAVNSHAGLDAGPRSVINQPTLARIRDVRGVAHADGRVVADLAMLDRNGRVLSNAGRVGHAVSVPASPAMSTFRAVDGRTPRVAGEAALDVATAERQHIRLGDTVTVLDPAQARHQLAVVGIVDFGAAPMFDGWSVLVLTTGDLAALTEADGYATVMISATPGTDPGHLRDAVSAALDDRYRVITGDQLRRALARDSSKYVDGFLTTMLASAIVALVVACLVVYNTFTILVAQRRREIALLRCVGASRRQLVAMMLGESVLVGLLASVGGVLFSVVVGRALLVGREVFGGGVPDHPLVVTPATVGVALVVGTMTTLASGLLPALGAARVAPLAALREDGATGASAGVPPPATRRWARWRAVRVAVAVGLAAGGLALTSLGVGRGFRGMPAVLGGAMVVFVAIVVALPLVIARLTRIVGWLPARLLGVPARLATANAQRNPGRAATTTTALMIGIALMSLFTVVLATAREEADREIAENFPIDYTLDAVSDNDGTDVLPASLVTALRARGEFGTVARSRVDAAFLDGEQTTVSTIEPAADGLAPEVLAGGLESLRPGTVAVRRALASFSGIDVGDTVGVTTNASRHWDPRVVAIYDDAPIEGDVLMEWSDFADQFGPRGDQVMIRRSAGTTAGAAGAALDEVLTRYPLVSVTSQAERRDTLVASLNKRLVHAGGLLGMSTLIAIIGIMDTLALSALERTRESATLRALGLGQRQLGGMLIVEALLMALVAALVGVGFGIVFGWLTAFELIDAYGHGAPTIPVLQLAGYVALAAVAGVLASVIPARRAARSSVVAAMADT